MLASAGDAAGPDAPAGPDVGEGAHSEDFNFRRVRMADFLQHHEERYRRMRRMLEERSDTIVLPVTRKKDRPLGSIRHCTVAGKPVASGETIGLRPDDGVVSSGVVFEP